MMSSSKAHALVVVAAMLCLASYAVAKDVAKESVESDADEGDAKSNVEGTVSPAIFWTSKILGTLVGLFCFLMPGLGKIVPGHPMYGEMVGGFDAMMGPFFGLPGSLLRFTIGLGYIAAGAGSLVALWCKASLGEYAELSQVLLICAYVGLITITIGGMLFHLVIEGTPMPMAVFCVVYIGLLYCRLQLTPLSAFEDEEQATKVCYGFASVCSVALVFAIISRMMCGAPAQELKDKAAKMNADTPKE